MSISFVSRVNGFTPEIAKPGPRILGVIKQKSSSQPQTVTQLTAKASGVASSYTKGFARKAYTLQISGAALSRGAVYAKPQ